MSLTTVLLADLPPMLEDMVSSLLQDRPDLRIVRGTRGNGSLVGAAVATGAQVVVTARANPLDLASIDPTLAQAASLSVLALSPDGASAGLHTLQPTLRRLEDVSADQILAAIVGAVPMGRA